MGSRRIEYNCKKCGGRRLITTSDNTEITCECLSIEKLKNYLAAGSNLDKFDLNNVPLLSGSPLMDWYRTNRSGKIYTSNIELLCSHVKTAILRQTDLDINHLKPFSFVYPEQLIAESITDGDQKFFSGIHLLILYMNGFPLYKKAAERHFYIFESRRNLGFPTWFAFPGNGEEIISRFDFELKNAMQVLGNPLRIGEDNTQQLLKNGSKLGKSGMGLDALSIKVLDINPLFKEQNG